MRHSCRGCRVAATLTGCWPRGDTSVGDTTRRVQTTPRTTDTMYCTYCHCVTRTSPLHRLPRHAPARSTHSTTRLSHPVDCSSMFSPTITIDTSPQFILNLFFLHCCTMLAIPDTHFVILQKVVRPSPPKNKIEDCLELGDLVKYRVRQINPPTF